MKLIVSLISIAFVLTSFQIGQSSIHSNATIFNKDSTIENSLEGTYSLTADTYKDNSEFVGHLYLSKGNYSFEYKRSYIDLSETSIPDFIFLEIKNGKYTVEYNVNKSLKPSELEDHQIIGSVSFSGNSSNGADNTLVKDLLLRIDKERHVLYFHSQISEFQTWSLEKYIETENNFKNSSEIPDTLQLSLKIKNVLPIDWGTKYSCDVDEVKKGYLDSNQKTFIISVSIGSEQYLDNIHLLEAETKLLITFINSSQTTDKPYIPAGTTGFLNEKGEI